MRYESSIILTAALLWLCTPNPMFARSVQEVLDDCKSDEHPSPASLGYGFCLGVAAGVSQVMVFNCALLKEAGGGDSSLASGQPPSVGAAVQAFINWAESHPESWGTDGIVGMMLAQKQTFPCTM